jgi:hypothetical protein
VVIRALSRDGSRCEKGLQSKSGSTCSRSVMGRQCLAFARLCGWHAQRSRARSFFSKTVGAARLATKSGWCARRVMDVFATVAWRGGTECTPTISYTLRRRHFPSCQTSLVPRFPTRWHTSAIHASAIHAIPVIPVDTSPACDSCQRPAVSS